MGFRRSEIALRAWSALLLLLWSAQAMAQSLAPPPLSPADARLLSGLSGDWVGTLERGGSAAQIRIHLGMRDGQAVGTFDWLEIGALHADLVSVRLRDGELRMALPLPLAALRLSGRPGTDRIAGRLEQIVRRANQWAMLPADGSFALRRARPQRPPYRIEPVRFRSGDADIAGDIYVPGGRQRRRAAVFVHGSGDSNRADGAYYADRLARAGIVTLVYDKRGVGQSGGNWRSGGYEELAQDAHAALEALRGRGDVDPAHVGYVVRSEGGRVGPLAVRLGDAAFLVALSGPTVTMADEQVDYYRIALRDAGVSDADMQAAFALVRLRQAVWAGGGDRAALAALVERSRSAAWFAPLDWDHGISPDELPFWARIIGSDPAPVLRNLGIPSCWIYGTDDQGIPAGDSIARLMALRIEPRPLIIVLPRADHGLATSDYPRLPGGVPHATRLFTDWINGL